MIREVSRQPSAVSRQPSAKSSRYLRCFLAQALAFGHAVRTTL
ncbi:MULTISPECIES: hypothetical protein [Moorena]|nr:MULTISPECIES: hypothetical protein [Moorena]